MDNLADKIVEGVFVKLRPGRKIKIVRTQRMKKDKEEKQRIY